MSAQVLEASPYTPTPRLLEVLGDDTLSPTAKVVYALLEEMGRGRPVGIRQSEIADLIGTSRKTVVVRINELWLRRYIQVSSHTTPDGKRVQTYRTRVTSAETALEPIIY